MAEQEKTGSQYQKANSTNVQQTTPQNQQQPQQQAPQMQASQATQNGKEGTSVAVAPSDIGKWWPIFGRKNAGSSSTFWLKNTKSQTLDDLDAEIQQTNNNINHNITDDTLLNKSLKHDGTVEELPNYLQIEKPAESQQQPQQRQNNNQQLLQQSINIQNQQLSNTITMTAMLNRIGKKKKTSKEYVYTLKGNYLAYFKQGETEKFQGYIKLGQEIVIEKKSITGRSGDIHYIEFLKDGNVRKLYSKDQEIVTKLFEAIRTRCILQNFRSNYKKLDLLGSGSFASVYKVQRISDNKMFAAKIIKKTKLEENKFKEKFVAMLVNEYLVLSQSHHKNIIRMEEIYQDSDQLCYIMEFLVGGEIYARLRTIKRFTEEISAEIMKNLTEGLQHIHNNKIVHRDLKLENIMFVNKTDNDCKLIDFGFAEKINYEKLESRAGTPGFLPPELFKLNPYTEKGDIFSLGVILYCLISGYSPFKGKTYKDVLDNNRKCSISYDQPIWAKVSDECKNLIKKMVESDPKKRYNCEDILKSKWMQKYYPTFQLDSQKSLNTNKTGKTKRKFNTSFSKNSLLDDDLRKSVCSKASGESGELNNSTIINLHSENPKSFYRKSMKSIKSIKSLKSHFSHKTVHSHSSQSSIDNISATNSNHDVRALALWENYKGKHFDNNVAKFKEEISNFCDVEDDTDETINLGQKLSTLLTPNKKFIHPLTLAACKQNQG